MNVIILNARNDGWTADINGIHYSDLKTKEVHNLIDKYNLSKKIIKRKINNKKKIK